MAVAIVINVSSRRRCGLALGFRLVCVGRLLGRKLACQHFLISRRFRI